MKKIQLVLLLLIGFSIISCSSDEVMDTDSSKLLKKVERFKSGGLFFDITINYNSNNQIESILNNKYQASPFNRVLSVNYDGNTISSIREVVEYESQYRPDRDITYDVKIEENSIILTSESVGMEFVHTNGYVDSIKEYAIENTGITRAAYLTRDVNQNLMAIEFGAGGSAVNSYSDFDSDKKVAPYGGVIDVMNPLYVIIFNLKLTANNPRTSSQSLLGTPGTPTTYSYEYDDQGYITRTYDENPVRYLNSFYVEE